MVSLACAYVDVSRVDEVEKSSAGLPTYSVDEVDVASQTVGKCKRCITCRTYVGFPILMLALDLSYSCVSCLFESLRITAIHHEQ